MYKCERSVSDAEDQDSSTESSSDGNFVDSLLNIFFPKMDEEEMQNDF